MTIDTADFVINLFLTGLFVDQKYYLHKYWASWSDSPLIKENTWNEYSAVIDKDVINSWPGNFGQPSWKVNYVKQVIRVQK